MEYEPLIGNEIRILHVCPSRDIEAEIVCTLSRRPLDASPYDALSYVWGERNPAKSISVNGI